MEVAAVEGALVMVRGLRRVARVARVAKLREEGGREWGATGEMGKREGLGAC